MSTKWRDENVNKHIVDMEEIANETEKLFEAQNKRIKEEAKENQILGDFIDNLQGGP